jgi:hypothetical protein
MKDFSKWIYWASPARAAFQSIVFNQLSGQTYYCTPNELVGIPAIYNSTTNVTLPLCPFVTGNEYLNFLSIYPNYLWEDLISLFGWVLALIFIWNLTCKIIWVRR